MADLFCKFIDCRSPSTNCYYKLQLLSPSSNSSSIVRSFSSGVVGKIRRWPILCKPASPAVDVISTHEHHDGSVLFRFGDPGEVVENLELEEPTTSVVDEEIESEISGDSSAVEVLSGGGDGGSEVVIKANGYGLTEVTDELESVEESSAVKDLDGNFESEVVIDKAEIETDGGLTEVTDEVESVGEVSISEDLDGDYESDVVLDRIEIEANGYGSAEVTDELDPDVSRTETVVSVERADESSDSEGESSDSEDELPVPTSSVEVEVLCNAGPDTENVTSDQELLEDLSLSNVSVNEVSNMENATVTAELPEKKIDDEIILQKGSLELDSGASESSSTDESVSAELQNVDVELENDTIQYVTDNGASSLETVDADESVTSELQSVNVELKNETIEDGMDNDASTLATVVAADESLISELQCVDAELNNETVEYSTDDHSSLEAVVITDEPVSTELQTVGVELNNETIENGKEIDLTDLPVNLSEQAQNSIDVSADSVFQDMKAETDIEIVEDGMESVSSELLSDSSEMQEDVSLLKEAECDNLELPMQSVATGDESEDKVNCGVTGSPELEEAINLSAGVDLQTSENGTGIPNMIVQDDIGSDPMEPTSVSPILETESRLDDEMGKRTVEEFKDDVIGDDGGESDVNDFVATSPESEEAFSAGVDLQTSENGMSTVNEIVQDEVESYVMESTSVSPTLETESKFHEELGEKAMEKYEEDAVIGDDGSENEEILLVPESFQEEAESIDYVVTSNDALQEFQDDDRVESPLSKVPEDMFPETEGTADDDNVQINQLPEALRDVVTVLGFTESATNWTEVMTDFVLTSGAALLPHPSKVLTGGEDAYFIAGQTWLGVADGVVQWSLEGTEPGVYAQDLIRNCENLASDCTGNAISYPIDLLKSSSAEMPSSGFSTVLIAQFDGQVLHVANVGDSGFIILRHGTVYKRSSPMLHAFHFPMLFAKDNDPSHVSELYEVELEEDDVIITATDGLFDNLYDQEISSIVMKSLAAELELEDIAALLAKKAQDVGRSTSSRSPFADSAQAAGYAGYIGGKLDDVTVIVSVVKRQSSSQTV